MMIQHVLQHDKGMWVANQRKNVCPYLPMFGITSAFLFCLIFLPGLRFQVSVHNAFAVNEADRLALCRSRMFWMLPFLLAGSVTLC